MDGESVVAFIKDDFYRSELSLRCAKALRSEFIYSFSSGSELTCVCFLIVEGDVSVSVSVSIAIGRIYQNAKIDRPAARQTIHVPTLP